MKKLIIAVVVSAAVALTGCAQRNPDGSHILDANGKEKISWPRTIAVVVGAPLLILGVAAMAKNSSKWDMGSAGGAALGGGGGYYMGSQYDDSQCDHALDTDRAGNICGGRAAVFKSRGRAPVPNSDDYEYARENNLTVYR